MHLRGLKRGGGFGCCFFGAEGVSRGVFVGCARGNGEAGMKVEGGCGENGDGGEGESDGLLRKRVEEWVVAVAGVVEGIEGGDDDDGGGDKVVWSVG